MPPTNPKPRGGVLFGVILAAVTCCVLVLMLAGVVLAAPVSLLTRYASLAPSVEALHGSLWRGHATLRGGYQLHWAGAVSFAGLPHVATDLVLEGADTRVTGVLRTGLRGLALTGADGRAGPGLAGLVEGAWDCDMTARVENVGVVWGWRSTRASGRIATPAGLCRKDGSTQDIPPLELLLGDADPGALVTLGVTGAAPMARVLVTRDRVAEITIAPEAADVFPVLPRGGPIRLELPF